MYHKFCNFGDLHLTNNTHVSNYQQKIIKTMSLTIITINENIINSSIQ